MTDEPTRFRDDPNEPGLGRDLSAAGQAPGVEYDVERGMDRFSAAVVAGAAGSAQSAPGQTAAQAGTGMAKLWPWAAGAAGTAAVTLGLVAGGVFDRAAPDSAEPPSVVVPAPSIVAPNIVAPQPSPQQAAPADEPPAAAPGGDLEPSPAPAPEPRNRAARPRPAPPPSTEATPSDPDERLRQEIALVASARALLAPDPRSALALLQEGERRFGRGILGEERQALRILALHGLGHSDEAADRAARFLAAHPRSPFADRVREFAP